eukprot:3564664-Amphidinium_carterae.1
MTVVEVSAISQTIFVDVYSAHFRPVARKTLPPSNHQRWAWQLAANIDAQGDSDARWAAWMHNSNIGSIRNKDAPHPATACIKHLCPRNTSTFDYLE